MERISESTQASDEREDVLELVLLGVFGLGPLVTFLAHGTGCGTEMGLGVVAALLAARVVGSTLAAQRPHDPEPEAPCCYRTAATRLRADRGALGVALAGAAPSVEEEET
jgi:hypothetical protein